MKYKFLKIGSLLIISFVFCVGQTVYANPVTTQGNPPTSQGNPLTTQGNPLTSQGNPDSCGGGAGTLQNPFKGGCSLYDLLKTIIQNILLPLGALLAVLAFIYAGFQYVMARGKPADIEKAHRTLLYAAIGTAILLGSWAIAEVIQNTVNNVIRG